MLVALGILSRGFLTQHLIQLFPIKDDFEAFQGQYETAYMFCKKISDPVLGQSLQSFLSVFYYATHSLNPCLRDIYPKGLTVLSLSLSLSVLLSVTSFFILQPHLNTLVSLPKKSKVTYSCNAG